MNLCKDCKYFETRIPSHHDEQHWKRSEDGRGVCINPKVSSDGTVGWWHGGKYPERTPDSIFADCDENRGHLDIGPEFGCVHWERT